MKSVITVIIVDDELTIRKGLSDLLKKQKKYHVIDVCKNGNEAYYSTLKNKPDIVITDVKMPGIDDGLSYIEKCNKCSTKTKFLILSGYDDFGYMKKAHHLNVVDYLLKPIDNDELIDTLDKISNLINKNKEEDDFNKNLLGHIFLEDSFLNPQVYNVLQNKYNIELSSLQIIVFSFDFSNCIIQDPLVKIKQYSENYLMNTLKNNFLVFIKKQKLVMVTSRCNITDGNLPNYLKYLMLKIRNIFKVNLVVGVSFQYNDKKSFKNLYYNSVLAILQKIDDTNKDVFFQNIFWNDFNENKLYSYYIKEKNFLNHSIQEYNLKECKNQVEIIIDKINNSIIPPNAIFLFINDLKKSFKKLTIGSDFDTDLYKLPTDIEKISSQIFTYNLKQIKKIIILSLEQLIDFLANKNQKTGVLIDDIINFINIYYMENISLETIYNNFYINPSYFSKIFKEKCGVNFNKYLTDIRINKAKTLLLSTNLKVYEVGRIVGYNNPKYFSKIFKENVNLSPADFKKQGV